MRHRIGHKQREYLDELALVGAREYVCHRVPVKLRRMLDSLKRQGLITTRKGPRVINAEGDLEWYERVQLAKPAARVCPHCGHNLAE